MAEIEIIGMIGVNQERDSSRGVTVSLFGGGINPADEIPAGIDPEYIAEFSQAHEDSGFDKVLIGYSSATAEGFAVAGYAAYRTKTLGYLIAHRAGFVAPTLAARHLATLDQLTGGRIALHVITGGSDEEQHRDGDWLDHDSRYRRTGEFMEVVKRVWTETTPFDYEGEFYRLEQVHSQVRTLQKPHVPLYFGGASEAAKEVGASRADVYALWGEPLAAIKEQVADLRDRAARYGRRIRFSLSVRPILGATPKAKPGSEPKGFWNGSRGRWAKPWGPAGPPVSSRWAPAGCWTSPPKERSTTSASGCPSPRPPEPPAAPPPWLGRPSRWPSPSWPTTTPDAPRC